MDIQRYYDVDTGVELVGLLLYTQVRRNIISMDQLAAAHICSIGYTAIQTIQG
jgi:hypothetical protein